MIKKQLILYCIEKCKFLKFCGLKELTIVNQVKLIGFIFKNYDNGFFKKTVEYSFSAKDHILK